VFSSLRARSLIKSRDIKNTVKRLTRIHKASINQNPFIILIPKIKRIHATIRPVILASHIAENDFSNPIFTDFLRFSHVLSSSFILSNMRIFASIAIPIDNTSPAIEARVRTTPNCLRIASVITIYINNATAAINPESLYINIRNNKIDIKPIIPARIIFSKEFCPSFASIVRSLVR
jgi:hypothetical protein